MTVNVVDTINSRIVYYYYTTGDTLPTPAVTDPKKEHIAINRDDGKKYQWNGTQWKEHASGGGGGGEQWTELPSSEWGTHVFSIGDRIRFTFKQQWITPATATDWDTKPELASGMTGKAVDEIRECFISRVSNDELYYRTLMHYSNNCVTISTASLVLISTGKLRPNESIISVSVNNGGAVRSDNSMSVSSVIAKIEYIPASA